MPKFFVKENQVQNNKITIIGSDVNHIINVLRMKDGDKLNICNADNSQNYLAEIINIQKKEIECKIIETLEAKEESNVDITIYQGLPKADKMELIIQKSTELGVKELIPVDMERCVSKINGKDAAKKIERWQKISYSAAKQSMRNIVPKVNDVINSINAIGQVTLQSEPAIVAARAKYEALPAQAKGSVTNYATLQAAETTLAGLKQPH